MHKNNQRIALVSFWDDIASITSDLMEYRAIFATEQAAIQLCDAGIMLDTVISDFDSIDNHSEALEKLRTCATVEVLSVEKDMTDTKAMFDHITLKYPGVPIDLYNTFDGRVDHSLALLSLFYQAHNPLVIYTKQTRMELLTAGTHEIPTLLAYKYISFIVLEKVENFVLRGLKYDTEQSELAIFTDLLVSNEPGATNNGIVRFTKGSMLLIYSEDA